MGREATVNHRTGPTEIQGPWVQTPMQWGLAIFRGPLSDLVHSFRQLKPQTKVFRDYPSVSLAPFTDWCWFSRPHLAFAGCLLHLYGPFKRDTGLLGNQLGLVHALFGNCQVARGSH